MSYKTSHQWRHQIVIQDNGFYWDSNFYSFDNVYSCRGLPIKKYVNFAHYGNLDEFIFDLFMTDGQTLRQEVKFSQRLKATTMLSSTSEAMNEIGEVFQLLSNKTLESRVKKYNEYLQKYKRYLLMDDTKGNTVSCDQMGNVYKNEKFFGSWFPSANDLDVTQSDRDQSIRFRKKSSNFLSSDRDCWVDTFLDHEIVEKSFELIGLPLSDFNEQRGFFS